MASFTDNVQQLTNFTPYIQQQPLEMMAKVGMYKQGQYDQGIEKIQKSFDTIAGMQVSDKHKSYLQSKLNEMGNQLKTVSASDFSNSQLVNNTASQINSISNDKIVQTGVNSALRQKKELEFMEKAREKGELTPAHLDYFQNQNNTWEQDDDLTKGYNARYINFFDADKLLIENISKVLPAGTSIDYAFEMDSQNPNKFKLNNKGNKVLSRTMTRLKEEGRMPEDVKNAIDLTFNDPRVKQEMKIRGVYNYKNYTPEMLGNGVVEQFNEAKHEIEKEIDNQYIELAGNPSKLILTDNIEKLKTNLKDLDKGFKNNIFNIQNDPDSARVDLHLKKEKNYFLNAFSNVKRTKEISKNVEYEQIWEERKEATRMEEARQKLKYDMANDAANRAQTMSIHKDNLEFDYYKEDNASNKKDTNNDGVIDKNDKNNDTESINLAVSTKESDYDPSTIQKNRYEDSLNTYTNSKNKTIFYGVFGQSQIFLNELEKEKNTIRNGVKISEEQAINNFLKKQANQRGQDFISFTTELEISVLKKHNTSKNLNDLKIKNRPLYDIIFENNKNAKIYKKEKLINDKLDADEAFAVENNANTYKIKNINIPIRQKTILQNGVVSFGNSKNYTISPDNMIQLSILSKYDKNNPQFIKSYNKIVNSGKKELADAYIIAKEYKSGKVTKKEYLNNSLASNDLFGKLVVSGNVSEILKKNKEVRNEMIRKSTSVSPNASASVFLGEKTTDDKTTAYISRIVTENSVTESATGEGSSSFVKNIQDVFDGKATMQSRGIIIRSDSNDRGGSQSYLQDKNGNKYNITNEQAKYFKMDKESIFKNKRFDDEETYVKALSASTKGNLSKPETFALYAPVIDTEDLPLLANTNYQVKIHYKYINNKYYPVANVSNGEEEYIVDLQQGYSNLSDSFFTIQQKMSPQKVEELIKIGKENN